MQKLKEGIVFENYKLLELLGRGNFSSVYLAENMLTKQISVLKFQKIENEIAGEAIKREVSVLNGLQNPRIVRILPLALKHTDKREFLAKAIDIEGEPWFYSLEYLGGGSLADLINADGKNIDLGMVLNVILSISEALLSLHENRIAHMDLKPQNILFTNELESKLMVDPILIDFGISSLISKPNFRGLTSRYAAPELRAREIKNIDVRKADVYALGFMFFLLLLKAVTGKKIEPSSKDNNDKVKSLKGKIPDQVFSLLKNMLSENPSKRPDIMKVVQTLREIVMRRIS